MKRPRPKMRGTNPEGNGICSLKVLITRGPVSALITAAERAALLSPHPQPWPSANQDCDLKDRGLHLLIMEESPAASRDEQTESGD